MIEDYFDQTASIERNTPVSDGAGGSKAVWAEVLESTGKLDGMNGSTGFHSEKRAADSTHVWICTAFELSLLTAADRFLINSIYYRITWLDNPMNWGRHLEIELKQWENDG